MVLTIAEANFAALVVALRMEVGEFGSRYHNVENRHIGTGSRRTEVGAEYCTFAFVERPTEPEFHCRIAAMAFLFEIDQEGDGDPRRIMLGALEITAEYFENILDNVVRLDFEDVSDSDMTSEGGAD